MGKATSVIALSTSHERAAQAMDQLETAGVDTLIVSTGAKDVDANAYETGFYRIGAQTFSRSMYRTALGCCSFSRTGMEIVGWL